MPIYYTICCYNIWVATCRPRYTSIRLDQWWKDARLGEWELVVSTLAAIFIAAWKGNNHTCVSNYRPISLLPILSIAIAHLWLDFQTSKLISLQQWGFQPKNFSVSGLVDVVYKFNGQKFLNKVYCFLWFTESIKFLTWFLSNHLLTNLEHLTLTRTYLGGYALSNTWWSENSYTVLNGKASTTCLHAVLHQVFLKGQSLAHCFPWYSYNNDSVNSAAIEGNCITLSMLMTCYYMKLITHNIYFICVLANKVGHWVTGSNLRLNSAKCKTMIVTRRRIRAVPIPKLKLYGQALERIFEYKI